MKRPGIANGATRDKNRDEESVNRSVYFRKTYFDYFSKLSNYKNVSFNYAINDHLKKTLRIKPEKIPDCEFGEFLFD